MRKIYKVTFLKSDYSVSFFAILVLFSFFVLGVVISLLFDIDIQDKLFSPFVFNFENKDILVSLFHNFVYFLLVPVLFLFCSTSFFGFIIIPFLVMLKSFFCGINFYDMFLHEEILKVFFLYGLIIAVEMFAVLVYASQAISLSLRLKKENSNEVYNISFNQSFVVVVVMTCLTVIKTLINYFF